MIALPPVGRWALGSEGQPLAEALLELARREGLGTAWFGHEARFLSNLSVLENLRLLFQWRDEREAAFDTALAAALARLSFGAPDWLHLRPAQLRDPQFLRASLLRLHLLMPEVVVVQPALLAQAGPALTDQLVGTFARARLLLLADPAPEWPVWPAAPAPLAAEEIAS